MKRLIKWLYLQTHKKERAAFRAKIKLASVGTYKDFRGATQEEFRAHYNGVTVDKVQDLLDALGV